MSPSSELAEKLNRIQLLLEREGLNGILLSTQRNFSWLTCGGTNHVGTSTPDGVASLLVLRDGRRFVISPNNERDRIADEETGALGFESLSIPWYELRENPVRLKEGIAEIVDPQAVGADSAAGFINVESHFARLRYSLTDAELERYRIHGRAVAEAVEETARSIHPGISEREVEALLAWKIMQRGARPTVLLVGSDTRFLKYRHPIPTDRRIERFVSVSTCARRWGLTAAVTRLVHFGKLPDDVSAKYNALQLVEARLLGATSPGRSAARIFSVIEQAYSDVGYDGEWREHHQGGATGYLEREWVATPTGIQVVEERQAFAWNPTIRGTKIEDTVLATSNGLEVLSDTKAWPMAVREIDGQIIERPQILLH